MPFKRQTLSELRDENRKFMQAELEDAGALLHFANLKVLADMDAGMAHLHYAYLDYIARQTNPFTATDENLAGWMAMKNVYRKPAAAATSPRAQFTGQADAIIPAGAVLNRGDGYQYRTDSELRVQANGKGVVAVTAMLLDIAHDVTGGGACGNAEAGTLLALDANIAGVDPRVTLLSSATGGADIEEEEAFRQRGLLAWQNPPQGGSDADYKKWALEVPRVTRVWVKRRLNGAGTVGLYIMCDGNQQGGFPMGSDGISQLEDWGVVKATGDQLAVADHIYPKQTDTAIVFVCSPIRRAIDIEIDGLREAGGSTVRAITSALATLCFEKADPTGSGKLYLSDINRCISEVRGTTGYILRSPVTNITFATGEIPAPGKVTFV